MTTGAAVCPVARGSVGKGPFPHTLPMRATGFRGLAVLALLMLALLLAPAAPSAASGNVDCDEHCRAPAVRYLHTAVGTGSNMIVWGGDDGSIALRTGGSTTPQPTRGRRRPRRVLPRFATTTRRCGQVEDDRLGRVGRYGLGRYGHR